MNIFKIVFALIFIPSFSALAADKDICPGGSEVQESITTNEAKFVKCSDGKIYALWGGGINGSKLPPGYREIVDRSWDQISGKDGAGGNGVSGNGAGGFAPTCSSECASKWNGLGSKVSKKRNECLQKCNGGASSKTVYGSYLANCELIGGGEFIRCPDDSLYQKTSTTFSEALRKGVEQKSGYPMPKDGNQSFGISPGGVGF